MLPNFTTPPLCACGCGQPILPKRHHRYTGTPRCLPGHANNWGDTRRETRTCRGCGKQWETTRGNHKATNYCSRDCYLAHHYTGKVTFTCGHCGKQWDARPKPPRRFCSETCRVASLAASPRRGEDHGMFGRRGPLSPGWKGGVAKSNRTCRSATPARRWRRAVTARDNHQCRRCGTTVGRMHAHHVLAWRDYPALRFDLSNGITLCIRCHRAVHFHGASLQLSLL